jgi:hypothetical protein
MKTITKIPILLLIVVIALSSCNMPSDSESVANEASTAAAQTVQAMLSATAPAAGAPTASNTPSVSVAPTLTFTPAPLVTNTPAFTATSTCNVAQFITDVTIPDGTVMSPNQAFTKKWRIKNIGSCAWNGYTVVFDSGESMGGPATKALGAVNPGQEVDIEMNLTAPATANTYRGYWRIVTNGNVLVPVVNGYQGKSFYVDIKVQVTATNTPTSTPTNTPIVFKVTGITYLLGTWSDPANTNCPRVTASITTNAPGTIKYKWTRMDAPGGGAEQTLVFAAAGTQTVNYDWSRGSANAGTATWVGIFVTDPNNQDFGKIDFSTACTIP